MERLSVESLVANWRGAANRTAQAGAWLAARSPARVLGCLIGLQWFVVIGLAAQVRHKGWIFYMGGDQRYYYTSGWALAHGHIGVPGIGYLLAVLELPLTIFGGPDLLQSLPIILIFNVVVLLPILILALYGIAVRIGGRLFAYWAVVLWILVPLLGILYANTGYHQKYTELTLPQALGLTALADFPTMVATTVSVYFCARFLLEERPQLHDALTAGVAAGAAIAIKPSASLFLLGPALAVIFTRRVRHAGSFIAGMAPALVTLGVWKWRGLGHLPFPGAYRSVRTAASSVGAPLLGAHLHRYFNFDWSHFGTNLDLLREHFWSSRLLQWIVVASAIGLGRRSWRALLLVGGWFGAYLFTRFGYPGASIQDATVLRLMIPAYPAFVLLLASLPFLVPGVMRRLPTEPEPVNRGPAHARLVALAIVISAALPLAAIAAAKPALGLAPHTAFSGGAPIPTDVDFGLTATTSGGAVHLRWKAQRTIAGPIFYYVYRACRRATLPCDSEMKSLGDTYYTTYTDRPRAGSWSYQIGLFANWLDDPSYGDPYVFSKPVTARAP